MARTPARTDRRTGTCVHNVHVNVHLHIHVCTLHVHYAMQEATAGTVQMISLCMSFTSFPKAPTLIIINDGYLPDLQCSM